MKIQFVLVGAVILGVAAFFMLVAMIGLAWWGWPAAESKPENASAPPDLASRLSPIGPDPALVALANAARKYGVDPKLFEAISRFETGEEYSPIVEPNCKNCTAQGMCQMIKGTRKAYGVKKAKYVRYESGPYISYLINEAHKQADACARFTRDHIAAIEKAVGRKPTPGEVYLCHLLGLGTGLRVIKASAGTSIKKLTSRGVRRRNKFISRNKTAGALRRAASRKIRDMMAKVSVPSEQTCAAQNQWGWR